MRSEEKEHTILLVEDDYSMRGLLRKALERNDYGVTEAGDCDQALERLKERPDVDLIVTDIRMPGRSGMELLKEVTKSRPEVKVILITSFGEIDQYLEAMNTGAFEYLNKPFKTSQFLDCVKRALD